MNGRSCVRARSSSRIMIPARRNAFNESFTQEKYDALHRHLEERAGVDIHFRLSETPCFLPASLVRRLEDAARTMVTGLLSNAEYMSAAEAVVPDEFRVAHDESRPTFLAVDLGLIQTDRGVEARLVELQAFPSLYGFQMALAEAHIAEYGLHGLEIFLDGLTKDQYLGVCRDA